MFTFQIVVDGVTEVLTAISRFGEYAKDLSEPYGEIADDFRDVYMQDVFASEGAVNGEAWAPLSPGYAAQKERAFPGQPLMIRTGDLADSLMGGAGGIRTITADTLILGTSISYAKYHNSDAPRKSNLPQRKLIRPPAEVRTRWIKIIQAALVKAAREAKLSVSGGS